jgi:hypothetical protein
MLWGRLIAAANLRCRIPGHGSVRFEHRVRTIAKTPFSGGYFTLHGFNSSSLTNATNSICAMATRRITASKHSIFIRVHLWPRTYSRAACCCVHAPKRTLFLAAASQAEPRALRQHLLYITNPISQPYSPTTHARTQRVSSQSSDTRIEVSMCGMCAPPCTSWALSKHRRIGVATNS